MAVVVQIQDFYENALCTGFTQNYSKRRQWDVFTYQCFHQGQGLGMCPKPLGQNYWVEHKNPGERLSLGKFTV